MFFWGWLFLGGGGFKGEGWRFLFRCQIGCRVLGVRGQGIGKFYARCRHGGQFPLRRWLIGISSVEGCGAVPVGVCFSLFFY